MWRGQLRKRLECTYRLMFLALGWVTTDHPGFLAKNPCHRNKRL